MGLDQSSLLLAALKGFSAAGSEKRVKIELHYHPETDSKAPTLCPRNVTGGASKRSPARLNRLTVTSMGCGPLIA